MKLLKKVLSPAAAATLLLAAVLPAAVAEQTDLIVEPGPEAPTSPGPTHGGTVATMPDGQERIWTVVQKNGAIPAYLAEINPLTSQLLAEYPLPDTATAAWGVEVGPDGSVYIGTYIDGNLYRLEYGASEIETLGRPQPSTSYIWRLAVADDGRVVVGTYEGYTPNTPAHVFVWDPSDESWEDYGSFGSQYLYVRSVEVVGDTIYAGLGSQAALMAIDMETKQAEEIPLPASLQSCQFVYNISESGNALYVHFRTCSGGQNLGYRYNLDTEEWDLDLGVYGGYDVSPVAPDGSVYLIKDSRLQRLSDGAFTATTVSMSYATSVGFATDEDTGEVIVVGSGPAGAIFSYDPSTDQGLLTYPTTFPQTETVVPTITDHGDIPIRSVTVSGATTVTMPNGEERMWAVATGTPAYLAEIDPVTNTLLSSYPMPGTIGGWGVTVAPDGSVYATSYVGGYMYRLAPGATSLTNLGRPLPTTSFLWRADSDADGRVYTGTFEGYAPGDLPPAHLAMWDPATEAWSDWGTFGAEQGYVRTVSVTDDKAYVGTGAIDGRIFEVDKETLDQREIPLPDIVTQCAFVYESSIAHDHVFFRFNDCAEGSNLGAVYDIEGDEWVGELGEYSGQDVLEGPDGLVYLVTNGRLATYDTVNHTLAETSHSVGSGRGLGYTTDPVTGEQRITGIMLDGRVWNYDPIRGDFIVAFGAPEGMEGTPIRPRRTGIGPDNRVYVSGYFSGRFAAYDPNSDEWESFDWPHQTEGIVAHDGLLYLGVYPGAVVYVFDPTKEFGPGNPRRAFDLTSEGQDRPFAMVSAGDYLAIGTVPAYGRNDGALALYNPSTGEVRKYPGILGEHSIAGLTYHDGVLYGGTSIWGGGGAATSDTTARIFAMDVETGELLWERRAPQDHAQVPALTVAPDGTLWGITVGTVFTADPDTGTITRAVEYYPQNWPDMNGQYANMGELYFDETDGFLYGVTFARALRIDPETWVNTAPAGMPQGLVVQHPNGAGFYFSGQNLYSAQWRDLDAVDWTAPVTTATVSPGVPGSGWYQGPVTVSLDAIDDEGEVLRMEYSLNGGDWVTVDGSFEISTQGSHEVHYRSIDDSLNIEEPKALTFSIDSVLPEASHQIDEREDHVVVSLDGSDDGSGLDRIEYRIAGGEWISYVEPVTVERIATTQMLEYRAVDVAGNVSDIHEVVVQALGDDSDDGDGDDDNGQGNDNGTGGGDQNDGDGDGPGSGSDGDDLSMTGVGAVFGTALLAFLIVIAGYAIRQRAIQE